MSLSGNERVAVAASIVVVVGALAGGSWYADAHNIHVRSGMISGANPSGMPSISTQQVHITDTVVGNGTEAKEGDTVLVHYTGTLQGGVVFDSSITRGEPYEFTLGAREVIQGWDIGIAGMREGGKRRLVIPPELAYGEEGAPDAIPPNATLTFDVELLEVK